MNKEDFMKNYNKPDVELIYFSEDVVTASLLGKDNDGDDRIWDF